MPATTETLLLQVDIQANNARLVELQKQLNDTKTANAALNQSFKEGKITGDELAAGQVRLATQTKNITQEVGILRKANADQQKATDAAKGSINQLRAELARGTAAYNALSEAERDNTEAGQKLQATNRAISDQLKGLEGAIGDTRRNVGNYAGSLKDAIKESGFLGGVTAKVTEAQEAFSKAQNIAKAAIGGNITALGFLRLALLATGLGAIVVVLGSLVAFLTKSQTGIDLVSRKFAGLKAVVDLVIGAAAQFGEQLFKALDNPKQAITDLVKFIETNLLNRVKAFAVIFQAIADRDFRKANDGLIQLATGITEASVKLDQFTAAAGRAATTGEQLEAESQRILRAERALNVERSQSRARIEELKKLSDDSTKSVAIRTQAAREATRIENGLLAAQLKLQDDKIKNELAGQRLRKVATNEDLDRLAEIRRERADTAQESFTLQTELQNKINSLATEGVATVEAARKKLDEAMLKSIEADIAAGKSREDAAVAYLAAEDKARAQAAAKLDQERTDKLAADAAAYARDLSGLERSLEKRRVLLETDKATGLLTQAQYEARLAVIEEGGLAARLLLAGHYNQDANAADIARTRFHNAQLEKQTAKQQAEYQQQLATAQQFGQTLGGIVASTLTDAGSSMEDFAGKVLLLILDSLEKAALAAAAEAIFNNAPKGFIGIVEGAAAAVAITAAFETVKAGLARPAAKQFHDGGLLEGPSHAGGGIPFAVGGRLGFEAEGGEAIMSKGAVQQFAPLLSHLNYLGGGKAFAAGGLVAQPAPRAHDGGLAARAAGNALPLIDYNALAAAMRQVPLEVGVTTLRKTESRYDRSRSLSTLGG